MCFTMQTGGRGLVTDLERSSSKRAGVVPPIGLEVLKAHGDESKPGSVELCVGTSIRVAPMEFLEAVVTLLQHAMDGAEQHLNGGTICGRPINMAIVKTCNRAEFYMAVEGHVAEEMIHRIRSEIFLPAAELAGLPCDGLMYVHRGPNAVRHLCRVSAGLDSVAIGEHQIPGQVAIGFKRAIDGEGGSRALVALAEVARRAGRRARAETEIGRGRVSLGSVGVELAQRELGSLDNKRVLVVGAGKVSRLVCSTLRKEGVAELTIVNRTMENAENLANDFGASAAPIERLSQLLAESDIVFTTTGSLTPILSHDLVSRAAYGRFEDRPMGIVDLAVPRDVEPGVESIEGVRLLGLTEIRDLSDANMRGRHSEIGRAEKIVEEEVSQYVQAMKTDLIEPLLTALWQRAELLRTNEVDRLFGDFDGIDPEVQSRITHFSHALVKKLLHDPSTRLRSQAGDEDSHRMSDALRELFGLAGVSEDLSSPDGG